MIRLPPLSPASLQFFAGHRDVPSMSSGPTFFSPYFVTVFFLAPQRRIRRSLFKYFFFFLCRALLIRHGSGLTSVYIFMVTLIALLFYVPQTCCMNLRLGTGRPSGFP